MEVSEFQAKNRTEHKKESNISLNNVSNREYNDPGSTAEKIQWSHSENSKLPLKPTSTETVHQI